MKSPRPRTPAGSVAARTRGRLARAHRSGDTDAIPILERQLQVDQAVEYIRELVDGWPPLTAEQRSTIAALLGGADGRDAA
jgi:hypothetical protein